MLDSTVHDDDCDDDAAIMLWFKKNFTPVIKPFTLFVMSKFVIAVSHFDFGFEARMLVLIGQVPGHCLLLAFIIKVVVVVPCHVASPVSLNIHLSSH